MTTPRPLTDFEQILLGLVGEQPRSGYELRRLFLTTPAAVYQPSGGALYPALRRLEKRGFLCAEQTASGGRSRRIYRATPAAHAATRRWVGEPVNPASVAQDLGVHLMRFVLMEPILGPSEVHTFLKSLCEALEAFLEGMERYIASNPLPGRHPRLALEHGIAVHRASLEWSRTALSKL